MQIYQGNTAVSEVLIRNGKRVLPVFHPHGGLRTKSRPGNLYAGNRICDVVEISDGSAEFENERTVVRVGKKPSEVNDGVTYTFTWTVDGNSFETQAMLLGIDLHDVIGIQQGVTATSQGHIQMIAADSSDTIIASTLLTDVQVKLTTISGATDGESNLEIEVTTSEVWAITGKHIFIKEIFFDGTSPIDGSTTITNADAPDGTLTSFRLGQGNGANVGDKGAAAVKFRDESGADAYIYEVRLGGSVTSGYTYANATGSLNFSSAPADGSILEVMYPVRTGARSWDSSKSYGIGEIVSYNNTYYESDAAASAGVIPTGSTPWIVYTGFGTAASGSTSLDEGNPVVPYSSGDLSFFLSGQELLKI